MKNYYKILQIRNFATNQEVKKSFRKLAMKYHPDQNDGRIEFEEEFKEIAVAYEILSDPIKKRDFDYRLILQNSNVQQAITIARTNYSKPNQQSKTDNKKKEVRVQAIKFPIFWVVLVVIFIIYLISDSNSDHKSTTGNTKADEALEKVENAKKPETGEIDFKK